MFSYQGSFFVLSQATAFIFYQKLYRLSRTFLFFADRSSDSFNRLPHRRDIVNNFFHFLIFRLRVFREVFLLSLSIHPSHPILWLFRLRVSKSRFVYFEYLSSATSDILSCTTVIVNVFLVFYLFQTIQTITSFTASFQS